MVCTDVSAESAPLQEDSEGDGTLFFVIIVIVFDEDVEPPAPATPMPAYVAPPFLWQVDWLPVSEAEDPLPEWCEGEDIVLMAPLPRWEHCLPIW